MTSQDDRTAAVKALHSSSGGKLVPCAIFNGRWQPTADGKKFTRPEYQIKLDIATKASLGGPRALGLIPWSLGAVAVDVDHGPPDPVIEKLGSPVFQYPTERGCHLVYKADRWWENSTWRYGGSKGEIRGGSGYVNLWAPASWVDHLSALENASPVDISDIMAGDGRNHTRPVNGRYGGLSEQAILDAFRALPNPGFEDSRSLSEAEELIAWIDPDITHDDWISVGMALHSEWPDEGLDLWERWSQGEFWPLGGAAKFKLGECATRWKTFGGRDGVKFGTLCVLAEKSGADLKESWRSAQEGGSKRMKPSYTGNGLLSDGTEVETGMSNITWAVHEWIPRNMFTLLAGDGGSGKTTIACSLAASLTKGDYWLNPDIGLKAEKCRVGFITYEEPLKSVLAPRLVAAGADMSEIKLSDLRTVSPGEGQNNLDLFKECVRQMAAAGCEVVIVDPAADATPTFNNEHGQIEVRKVVSHFEKFAEEYKVALVGIHHMRKGNFEFGDGIMGSKAWRNVPRVVLGAKILDDGRRLFRRDKSNLCDSRQGFYYDIEETLIRIQGKDAGFGKVVWEEATLDGFDQPRQVGRPPVVRRTASDVILEVLRTMDGEVESSVLMSSAIAEMGCSERTFIRARSKLKADGLIDFRRGEDNKSFWFLVDEDLLEA